MLTPLPSHNVCLTLDQHHLISLVCKCFREWSDLLQPYYSPRRLGNIVSVRNYISILLMQSSLSNVSTWLSLAPLLPKGPLMTVKFLSCYLLPKTNQPTFNLVMTRISCGRSVDIKVVSGIKIFLNHWQCLTSSSALWVWHSIVFVCN